MGDSSAVPQLRNEALMMAKDFLAGGISGCIAKVTRHTAAWPADTQRAALSFDLRYMVC
jgi:hypothetical protein